ncbi:MAG: TasA family protein [Archaeoglobales archaeon]|nr:TasA family protein [Archaeoglobales archaeon]
MRKFGAMFVVLLVALGLVGATYAVWTDTVKVSGTVSTGTFDVKFTDVECDEVDYATIGAYVDGDNAVVNIQNAYPGLEVSCTFTVENAGTVPAKAISLSYTPNPLPNYVTVTGIPQSLTLNPGEYQDITVTLTFDSDNTPEEALFTYEVTVKFQQAT